MEDRPLHRETSRATALALGIAVSISISACGSTAPEASSSPAPTVSTSARHASLATRAAVTSTTPAPPRTPSTTVVRNTLLRYWGPITGTYADGGGLQLSAPGSGVTPRVTWQEAAQPCNRSTGTNNCAAQTIPEDVFLAVGTETNSGQTGPGGSIIPVMDNTLVYVIAETFSCTSPSGGPNGPGPTSLTTTPRVYSCVSLDFVDADTGRGLFGMDSPQLSLPPHT